MNSYHAFLLAEHAFFERLIDEALAENTTTAHGGQNMSEFFLVAAPGRYIVSTAVTSVHNTVGAAARARARIGPSVCVREGKVKKGQYFTPADEARFPIVSRDRLV